MSNSIEERRKRSESGKSSLSPPVEKRPLKFRRAETKRIPSLQMDCARAMRVEAPQAEIWTNDTYILLEDWRGMPLTIPLREGPDTVHPNSPTPSAGRAFACPRLLNLVLSRRCGARAARS